MAPWQVQSQEQLAARIRQLSRHVRAISDAAKTESQTRQWLIEPFLLALGFNPYSLEMRPENLEVDSSGSGREGYVLYKDEIPVLAVDCLDRMERLAGHAGSLVRYLQAGEENIGILTNGLHYEFYSAYGSDAEVQHPFLSFRIDYRPQELARHLLPFTKTNFNEDLARREVDEARVKDRIARVLDAELENPSAAFVELLVTHAGIDDAPRTHVEAGFRQFVLQRINDAIIGIAEQNNYSNRNGRQEVNGKRKPLLVLDIDETLIYSSEKTLDRPGEFVVPPYKVYCRPHAREFLLAVAQHFELGFWSSGRLRYVRAILDRILPGDIQPVIVWGRERCQYLQDAGRHEEPYVKDLNELVQEGYRLDAVLIVEDTPEKVRLNQENGVFVRSYRGESDDDELLQLAAYLKSIHDADNLQALEKSNWRQRVHVAGVDDESQDTQENELLQGDSEADDLPAAELIEAYGDAAAEGAAKEGAAKEGEVAEDEAEKVVQPDEELQEVE